MKTIASINSLFPTIDENLGYFSGESLRDHDIAVFDPTLPALERIHFSGGGSCIDIEHTKLLKAAMAHWSGEIMQAVRAGKTVFVLLSRLQKDSGAASYEVKAAGRRQYSTIEVHNYEALPIKLEVQNAKGRHIRLVDGAYRGLFEALEDVASYNVILERNAGSPIFATKDGATIGSVLQVSGAPGHLVLLPYFDLVALDDGESEDWSEKSTRLSHRIVSQLIAIDAALTSGRGQITVPDWVTEIEEPRSVAALQENISSIEAKIKALNEKKAKEIAKRDHLRAFSRLLYANGRALEEAIEESLKVLGFVVENFRKDDLEIDHIIMSPSGCRMIGESEGKDTSAIDISKFRQLESNINEDFEREEIVEAAKGVLFGNDHRLTNPKDRGQPFTDKCLKNAKRLGTALVRTTDLYNAVVMALDRPNDDAFRAECRKAIETAEGEMVVFPLAGPDS